MTRTLLLITAAGAAVCVAAFSGARLFGPVAWAHESDGGPAITRDLAWTGTDDIHIGGSSEISYTQGPVAKFTVTGPADVVKDLRLDGDTLERDHPHHWGWSDHGRLHIVMTSPHTHSFSLSGSNRLTLAGYDQDSLELHLSGSSKVTGAGKAKHTDLHISGSGNVDMGKLPVDDATIRISGSGSAILDPKQSADVSISGSGRINLLSKPAHLQSHISGSGSINTP